MSKHYETAREIYASWGVDTEEAIRKNIYPGLDLIFAGDVPPNPSELLGSSRMEQLMEERSTYRYSYGDTKRRVSDQSEKYHLGVATPILSQGDLMGCAMILLEENDEPLTEPEQKLVQTVAGFLGRQLES